MSSHRLIEPLIDMGEIFSTVMSKAAIEPEDLDFMSFVAIYKTDWGEDYGGRYELNKLKQVLIQGGFQIISKFDAHLAEILPKIQHRDALTDDLGMSIEDYELLLRKLTKFGDAPALMDKLMRKRQKRRHGRGDGEREIGGEGKKTQQDRDREKQKIREFLGKRRVVKEKDRYRLEDELNDFSTQIAKLRGNEEHVGRIVKELLAKVRKRKRKSEPTRVHVMLLATEYEDYSDKFTKLNVALKPYLPEGLKVYYSSANRVQALIDVQVFFPDVFRVKLQSWLMLPDFNQQGSVKGRFDHL
jgi:hypothetical protein